MHRRFALTALALLATVPASAQTLEIQLPWARATAGRAPNGAGYLTIVNPGTEPDRLVAAHAPIARATELHTHIMDGGIMRMREVAAIEVNPGEPAVLQPGGLHVMFMGLHAPLREGTSFPLTLRFEKAGEITVEVRVLGVGARHHGH